MVLEHYNQMVNTMELLDNAKFSTLTIPPQLESQNEKKYTITWGNQVFNEGINAKNFSLIDSFQKALLNRSFQILLFDNSIIRCSLNFEDDILITQNFSWIPCPINIDSYELSLELEPDLITEEIMESNFLKERILMRSPVRFDYDFYNDKPDHPSSHFHVQNAETRINTNKPICFNTFMKHIIETYYPESYYVKKNIVPDEVYENLKLERWSGLSLKTYPRERRNVKYEKITEFSVEVLSMG